MLISLASQSVTGMSEDVMNLVIWPAWNLSVGNNKVHHGLVNLFQTSNTLLIRIFFKSIKEENNGHNRGVQTANMSRGMCTVVPHQEIYTS